jgi:uncharacterized protein YtpQ (UPF0354 family)
LHWSLDVILKEDESRKRNNNVAENFSIVLKLVLKLLQEKQLKNKKISIKRMRKMAAWNLDYLIEMLNLMYIRFLSYRCNVSNDEPFEEFVSEISSI